VFESQILQIHRDVLKRGCEATFREVEEAAARACAQFHCPHPHLAMESLAEPAEVWWLNAFGSEAERQHVSDLYASNRSLMAALEAIVSRRDGLLEVDEDIFVHRVADRVSETHSSVAGARFVVVQVTTGDIVGEGPVFASKDGRRFAFMPAASRADADDIASRTGREARVFAVRPYWGMPTREWIDADPEFWQPNPWYLGNRT
jgi:hypothetical protein